MTLPLPPLLTELLAAGRWPRTPKDAIQQNIHSLVYCERIRAIAPEEYSLYLQAPPFFTVRELSNSNEFWTWPTSDPGGIDFDLAIEIGDFGLGSDAPILLDYRGNLARPSVIRLRWSKKGSPNQWIPVTPDFDSFALALGLCDGIG
jgi:hypothetical protein